MPDGRSGLRAVAAAGLMLAAAACAGDHATDTRAASPAVTARVVDDGSAVAVRVTGLQRGMEVGPIRLHTAGETLRPEGRTDDGSEGIAGRNPSVSVGVSGGSAQGVEPSIALSIPLFSLFWGEGDGGDGARRPVTARIPVPKERRDDLSGSTVSVPVTDAAGTTRTFTATLGETS